MNDIKRAIETLDYVKTSVGVFGQEDDIDLAISALEKQSPIKPLGQRYVYSKIENELIGYCPVCKIMWDVGCWERYCSNCGQKLDWSVEE